MKKIAPILLLLTLVVSGCSLFGGGDDESSAPRAKDADTTLPLRDVDRTALRDVGRGGTLRLAVPALPTNFNPAQVDGLQSDAESLLAPTSGSAIRPDDRGDWSVDRDYARSVKVVDSSPLTIAVSLNPKAVWQDGRRITSRDMVAYARTMSGRDDAYEVGSSDGWDDIARVQPKGAAAYRVVFRTPRSDWPRFVYPRLPQSVSTSAKRFNDAYGSRAVPSNGPFVVKAISAKTGTVTMVRNPRWWGSAPRLAGIRWRAAAPDVAVKALEADELDAATLTEDTAGDLPDGTTVRRSAGDRITQLTFNAGRGALRNADVRRAVALAVDRRDLARRQARALGTPAVVADSLVVAPGQPAHQRTGGAPDLDAARKALRKAGYRVGDKTTKEGNQLTLTLPVPDDDDVTARRAERIEQSLAAVGIAVKTRQVDAAKYYDDVLVPLDFDLTLTTWDASPLGVAGAQARYRPITSPLNFTGVAGGHAAQWSAASRTLDPKKRATAIRKLDDALRGDHVAVPLLGQPRVVAVTDRVANYGVSVASPLDWTRVGLRD